ncbi:hypothetical protein [Rheinheimera sp.]|uniref:hypothetical protein n=1 Tax=Rheinheimera sp. TaxID=1869214 RepID=UPI00404790C2
MPRSTFGRVQHVCTGHSLTKQSFKDECDINNIMARMQATGVVEHLNRYQGTYGDFTDAPTDYQSAIQAVLDARSMFQTVPAKIRAQFGNDPGAFLSFVQDPSNHAELVNMGLALKKPEAPEPQTAQAPPASSAKPTPTAT